MRGEARFDPQVFKQLRASREVGGRKLSAAALARLLNTSKARVLAYESGASVPELGRIQQIAEIYRVPIRELHRPDEGRIDQIKDYRSYAGLTAAQLAELLDISRTTYRNIENSAVLPVRHDGTLLLRLAKALDVPLPMVYRALDRHPAAAARREEIAAHLTTLFLRAHELYTPAVINPDETALQRIATLLRRPPSAVCRLVNQDLGTYRLMIRRLADKNLDVAYAQSTRAKDLAVREGEELESHIEQWPFQSASVLMRFLAEAMTSQQWRTMVGLLTPKGAAGTWVDAPTNAKGTDVWSGLIARDFVEAERTPDGVKMVATYEGWRNCSHRAGYYGCLYPRVALPARFRRPPHQSYLLQVPTR